MPALAHAQSADGNSAPDPAKLIEALKAKGTRGVAATSADIEAAKKKDELIQALKAKAARGLSVADRRQLAEATQDKPGVDIEVNFDFNSSEISGKVRPTVMALGQTLSSADLKSETFMVAGHTDGKGRAAYNQKLSERRSQSVKDFLIANFGLREDQLMVVGYGSERLKTPDRPNSEINRRVQVVNISPTAAARAP